MNLKQNTNLTELAEFIKKEQCTMLQDEREELRITARENIHKLQLENSKTFNRNRKPAKGYKKAT